VAPRLSFELLGAGVVMMCVSYGVREAKMRLSRGFSPSSFSFTFSTFLQLHYHLSSRRTFVKAIHRQTGTGDKKQALYNLFAAYLHTVPLEQLVESVERARLDAKLKYVVMHGAACSYCLSRAERLDGSYLRTFALELKEQLAQTLTTFVTSILTEPRRRLDSEEAAEPPLRQIIDVLQQVMCKHDAEKLAISVLEIWEDGYQYRCDVERESSRHGSVKKSVHTTGIH
jgi:hypothetical protein